ncbi:hypothetical protein [Synechocystis sp. LKSZ1]
MALKSLLSLLLIAVVSLPTLAQTPGNNPPPRQEDGRTSENVNPNRK